MRPQAAPHNLIELMRRRDALSQPDMHEIMIDMISSARILHLKARDERARCEAGRSLGPCRQSQLTHRCTRLGGTQTCPILKRKAGACYTHHFKVLFAHRDPSRAR